tara:strand:- start:218 stop:547 length:330 start_codon:yes stop_codon:yes gene_type:complete
MTISKSELKSTIEKKILQALESEVFNITENKRETIDLLETKLDQISGQITQDIGHVRLDSDTALLNLIADSIIEKLDKADGESIDTLLQEEVEKVAHLAASQLKINLGL